MARKRRNNRRRKGNFSFLYKALSIILICGAIVAALALFFKINTVTVSGNSRYTQHEILTVSGINTGDNLFLLNKYDTARQIYQKLPYVTAVRINRELPDTLVIDVTECRSAAAVVQDGSAWLISDTGKIVDQVSTGTTDSYALVTGVTLVSPAIGAAAVTDEGGSHALAQLMALMGQLQSKDMMANVQEISLEDASRIRMRYAARFTVEFSWDADYSYKLNNLNAVIGQLQDNEKGTINLTQDGKASFIPQ